MRQVISGRWVGCILVVAAVLLALVAVGPASAAAPRGDGVIRIATTTVQIKCLDQPNATPAPTMASAGEPKVRRLPPPGAKVLSKKTAAARLAVGVPEQPAPASPPSRWVRAASYAESPRETEVRVPAASPPPQACKVEVIRTVPVGQKGDSLHVPERPPSNERTFVDPTAVEPVAEEAVPVGASRLGPFEVLDGPNELCVRPLHGKVLRTTRDIFRTAVTDPKVCELVQFNPREVSIVAKGPGATHVSFWFQDLRQPITYVVRVAPE